MLIDKLNCISYSLYISILLNNMQLKEFIKKIIQQNKNSFQYYFNILIFYYNFLL